MKLKKVARFSSIALSLMMVFAMVAALNYTASAEEYEPIESVKIDISAPKCGAEVSTTETSDGIVQTNAPVATVPAGENYELYPGWSTSGTMWIVGEDEGTFFGKLTGGKKQLAVISLVVKEGYWLEPTDPETRSVKDKISVTGGEIVDAFAYDDDLEFVYVYVNVPIEHDWDGGSVTQEPTTAAEGVKTFKCKHCDATKTESIPKLDPPKNVPVSNVVTRPGRMSVKKNSITLRWNKVEGADGYDIFFARCNHGGNKIVCRNVKNIEGNNVFTWTKSGLKAGKPYKSYIKAYVMENGQKKYINTTPTMHAYTGNGTKKYTNAKSVTVKKSSATLTSGGTFKIKAKVKKMKKNRKLMKNGHAPKLRYVSMDSNVATVSADGTITAKGKGQCIVYVFAHNGVSKPVSVTVN